MSKIVFDIKLNETRLRRKGSISHLTTRVVGEGTKSQEGCSISSTLISDKAEVKIQFLEGLLSYLKQDLIYGQSTDRDAEVRDGGWSGEELWQGFDGWDVWLPLMLTA